MEIFNSIAWNKFVAYGGFMLGLINILILIHKEFFKSAKLEITPDNLRIKEIQLGYDFSLDLRLFALHGNCAIKKVYLVNEYRYLGTVIEPPVIINVKTAYPLDSVNLLRVKDGHLSYHLRGLNAKSTLLNDFFLEKESSISFCLSDSTYPNGYSFPIRNWKLVIEYNEGKKVSKRLTTEEVSYIDLMV